jgi:polyferredoxin
MVAMAKSRIRPAFSRLVRWRIGVQMAFLFVWLDPLMLRLHNICGPVFHCYSCPLATFACPIGVLANFSALHMIPLIALGTFLFVGGLLGAFICGWVCPFGLLQDLIGKVPTPKLRLPSWTGYTRYAVLVGLVLLIPFFFGDRHPLFICSVCPAGGLEAGVPNMVSSAIAGGPVAWPSTVKIAIIIAFLASAFFIWRPWCTVFCPLGAIWGLFNHVSVFFLQFHPRRCTSCGLCRKQCRYGVKPDMRANDPRCIRCLECVRCEAITVENALTAPAEAAPEEKTEE